MSNSIPHGQPVALPGGTLTSQRQTVTAWHAQPDDGRESRYFPARFPAELYLKSGHVVYDHDNDLDAEGNWVDTTRPA
jgi:hypothetical protein